MPLRVSLSNTWSHIQGFLFPMLRDEVGPLTDKQKQVVVVLEVARIEAFVQMWPGLLGRPPADRHAIARAFVAKAVLGLPQTNMLIEGAHRRQDAASAVWLGTPRTSAERSDLLARLRGVRRSRVAGSRA